MLIKYGAFLNLFHSENKRLIPRLEGVKDEIGRQEVCGRAGVYISKVRDPSRGWPEGCLFDLLLHQGVREGATLYPGLLNFSLDPYLIMLSVKQGSIKYHFLSLWYDSTWDWAQVFRAIGEHSNPYANLWYIVCVRVYLYRYMWLCKTLSKY